MLYVAALLLGIGAAAAYPSDAHPHNPYWFSMVLFVLATICAIVGAVLYRPRP